MIKKMLIFAVLLLSAFSVAHERQLFEIGGKDYLFIVGSLNEPVFVDDKSGVDLRVLWADVNDSMNSKAPGAKPVTGLEKTLQVELSAGGKKTIQALKPRYNDAGAYDSPFYPTVATTLTYRVFGSINGTAVDLSFTSIEGEHGSEVMKGNDVLSPGVVRKARAGGFGSPKARTGFPEPYLSNSQVADKVIALEQKPVPTAMTVTVPSQGSSKPAQDNSMLPMILSLVAIVVACYVALVKK